jgi:hypothetical protein
MARLLRSLAVMGLVVVTGVGVGLRASASPDVILVAQVDPAPKESAPPKKVGTPKKKTTKKGLPRSAMPAEAVTPAPAAATPAETAGGLKFSRDIAPILVANCARCHIATHRSGFNQTTFEGLLKGGKIGNDIVPGKPEESLLVLRIKGEEGAGARMPPGNARLAEGAIAKIEQWVKEGARLDAGIEANAPMAKYAAAPDDLRKAELAKMSPDDRDKKTEATGRDRLKKADPNSKMELTKGAHVLLFSNLPKDRASLLVKTMDKQYLLVGQVIGAGKLNFVEKISLYVFKESKGFTEFVRTVENQEVDPGEEARAKLGVESPYLIAVDPLAGGPEVAVTKKSARSKKGDDSPGGPERTLSGLLTEQLTAGSLNLAGKPPRWISAGVGALLASKLEPRSTYYKKLRLDAAEQYRLGWNAKAQESMGDTTKPETVRAVGFAICDWLLSSDAGLFTNFVRAMLEGGAKLDEAIGNTLGSNREQFLALSGQYIAQHYGAAR